MTARDLGRLASPAPAVVEAAAEPHFGYNVAKRTLDIAVALGVLTVTAPIWLLASALIVAESGRPVLFTQARLGFKGAHFTCYKFRSMVPDAEARIGEAMAVAATDTPEFKSAADPRVTRLGRLLRSWSVDELPQLLNVLRGDMSIVGPRPIAVWEGVYQGHGWSRLSVKPGLTGTWQVSGRSTVGWEPRMALDAEYVRGRSLAGDLWIMLRTPWAILTRRGAV